MTRILSMLAVLALALCGCSAKPYGKGSDDTVDTSAVLADSTQAEDTHTEAHKADSTAEEATEMKEDNRSILKVGSYNIKHGAEVGLDMSVIADDILSLGLDVVGLQEVDIRTSRVNGADTLQELARASGYEHYRFAKAINYRGGEYGTAILSRYPIKEFEVIPLYTDEGLEARSVGHAVIELDGTEFDLYNTHLSYENKEVRTVQFSALARLLKSSRAFILTGDFNTADMSEFYVIEDATLVNNGRYATFPSSHSAIDNIVLAPCWSIASSGMLKVSHSDHYMLWAELRLSLE